MKNPLIEKYGQEKRWVNWQYQEINGRKTKMPYSIAGTPASSTDVFTWSTYDEAKNASDQVGIIFTPDQTLLGIDIDKCLSGKNITHEEKEKIVALIIEADTYTEISPSKKGLHIYLALSDSLSLQGNKKSPYELYTSGRYFTFTGTPYKEALPVRCVSSEEALRLLSIIGYPWNKKEEQIADVRKVHSALDDATVLEKMFAAKNGKKVRALYDGDISAYKDDKSNADMALCSILAFWTAKDRSQIERIWVASPLGQREKTAKRQDYRTRTINSAIALCKDVYTLPPPKAQSVAGIDDLDILFVLNSKKDVVYLQNTENICRVLRKHHNFAGRFRYDAFTNNLEILPTRTNKWRIIENNDAVNIQTAVQTLFPEAFGKVGKDIIFDAMIKVAVENSIDSAIDYITALKWDKKYRLDNWLTETYGVPLDKYHIAIGSNWLKGLVKRLVEPGCKFDYVLVLEGAQGSKKSTSLAILGGAWHVETAMSTESKDFFMQFQGKSIIEFSEGETLSRTEVKRMKAIITMQSDKYRPPYERTSQEFPRRCVFAMTTNQTEYLKDETGNRRWLPLTVAFPEANIDWLTENRDQLFAEAYHRVHNLKETIYEFPKEETLEAQNARRVQDPSAEIISDWYHNILDDTQRSEGITVHEVYKACLASSFYSKPLDKYNEMIIADILKNNLKLKKERTMKDKIQTMRWYEEGNEAVPSGIMKEETIEDMEKRAAFENKHGL